MTLTAGILVVAAAVYFLGGTNAQTAQADSGTTTEAVAEDAGARVLTTDPKLKVEPK